MYWGKNGSTEHSRGNKTAPEKVATTRTEDGQKQYTNKQTKRMALYEDILENK